MFLADKGVKVMLLTSRSLKKSRESARLKIISSIHRPSETALAESYNNWDRREWEKKRPYDKSHYH